jgi:hypothetical protein
VQITIKPLPPFDFDLTATIFSNGDERMQKCEGGIYWHAIWLGDRPVLFQVKSTGTTNNPELKVEIQQYGSISPKNKREI